MGPSAADKHWTKQIEGYLSATHRIAAAQVAPSIGVKTYNIRAVTKLSYPAQFLTPPPNLVKLEKYAFIQIFRLPYNALSHPEQFSINSLGITTFKSMSAVFTASKVRYLHSHHELISSLHSDLLNSLDDISLGDAVRCTRSHWDSQPLILNIIQGAGGAQFSDDEDHISSLIQSALTSAVAANAKIQKSIYDALHATFYT
eukprot:10247601-Karenia_brevis.AAC.1